MIKEAFMKFKPVIVCVYIVSVLFIMNGFCDDSLHKAAYHGDLETVRKLLEKNPDPDLRDSSGGTALHAAMFQRNMKIVKILIEKGFDVNAQGTFNGYSPLHDAVWANNIEAARILLSAGAKTDIIGKDGLTPYQKALKEKHQEIADCLKPEEAEVKSYEARTCYSENDVKSFVYGWFAGFDHQNDSSFFKKHLDPEKVDMHFPDFPIKNIADFDRWYAGVVANIRWNSHGISNLEVTGDQKSGFSVSLDIHWKARTYDGKDLDVPVHQDWKVRVDDRKNFIIEKHRAAVSDNK